MRSFAQQAGRATRAFKPLNHNCACSPLNSADMNSHARMIWVISASIPFALCVIAGSSGQDALQRLPPAIEVASDSSVLVRPLRHGPQQIESESSPSAGSFELPRGEVSPPARLPPTSDFPQGPVLSPPLPAPRNRTAQPHAVSISPSHEELPQPNPPPTDAADWDANVFGAKQQIPPNFTPWWQAVVTNPLRSLSTPYQVDVETLILDALRYSQQVRAISDTVLIRESEIVEAAAAFDVHAFMESKFVRTSDPVGNTLTTGGPPRFRESNWRYSSGLRKKSQWGGTAELSQRIGLQDNNSIFFIPPNQGNSRLTLSYSQPLLNGAGQAYNASLIVLAEIDAGIAENETSRQLQEHLLKVTQAYWELYLQRAALLQKQRNLERASEILEELEHRRGVDSLQSQIVRARAAVASRRAELIRAAAAIRNAEATLRALVNAPQLCAPANLELVPFEPPLKDCVDVTERDALLTALQARPEIDEAMKRLKAASVRLDMSKNELLPALNLVLESYVSGLQGSSDIGQSVVDQFSVGEPSYTAGLVFDMPLHNRVARARFQRRQLELRQMTSDFQATVEVLKAEVEIAVREVHTSYRETQSKYVAMRAADTEVSYLFERWRLLPGDDRSASFLLEDLLDAQNRLAAEEFGFAEAQFAYTVALAELNRVTGTLLKREQITPRLIEEDGLPRTIFEKPTSLEFMRGSPAPHDASGAHTAQR